MSLLYNINIRGETIDDVYTAWMEKLVNNASQPTVSRVGNVVSECLNASTMIIDPTYNILGNEVRKLSYRYAIGELLWYLSGRNDTIGIGRYTKVWDKLKDEDGIVQSNYGQKAMYHYGFNQIEQIIKQLTDDKSSRQAVIHIKQPLDYSDPKVKEMKDIPCTLTLQFLIRDANLYMVTNMRSNDFWLGMPYDIFQFTSLQIYIANKLGVNVGAYMHNAASLHLYEKDYLTIKERMKDG